MVIEGEFDGDFQEQPSNNAVCVTTSLHLLTLTILNQLYGLNSKEFYKGDPQRFVRTTLMTQRLLGIRKLTLGWPVYAFGVEALGQAKEYQNSTSEKNSDPLLKKTKEKMTPIEAELVEESGLSLQTVREILEVT